MNNEDEQQQELEAFELCMRPGKLKFDGKKRPLEGVIEITFDPLTSPITLFTKLPGPDETTKIMTDHLVEYPMVTLAFTLPAGYPTIEPADVKVESLWMTKKQHAVINEKLSALCEENLGNMVLFLCHQLVLEEVTEALRKESRIFLNNSESVKKNQEGITIYRQRILDGCEAAHEENFNNECYDCNVCFENKMGMNCVKFFPCAHVFCKDCVNGYYKCIAESGSSSAMTCLADKCESIARDKIVKDALGEEAFELYETRLLDNALDTMDDMIVCPRPSCQQRATIIDNNTHLAHCNFCRLSFCSLCRRTYHGKAKCKLRTEDKIKIVKEWEASSEKERETMSQRYGGMKNLKDLVETIQNDDWLAENSKPCPRCSAYIEKTEGCHKMHCTKCDCNFCWLCGQSIRSADPYAHFNAGGCSGRLFDGIVDEEPDDFDLTDDDDDDIFWRFDDETQSEESDSEEE